MKSSRPAPQDPRQTWRRFHPQTEAPQRRADESPGMATVPKPQQAVATSPLAAPEQHQHISAITSCDRGKMGSISDRGLRCLMKGDSQRPALIDTHKNMFPPLCTHAQNREAPTSQQLRSALLGESQGIPQPSEKHSLQRVTTALWKGPFLFTQEILGL